MRNTVIGCGYLGATHAAAMAELGHEVLGVEIDPVKRASALRGGGAVLRARPGRAARPACRLGSAAVHRLLRPRRRTSVTCTSSASAPRRWPRAWRADLSQVESAIEPLAAHLTRPALVVGKSTVPVGTAARMARRLAEVSPAGDDVLLAWNPEFLREGFAVEDTLHPDRIVLRRRRRSGREGAARVLRPDDRRRHPGGRHRLRDRRAGQGRRERLPGHQDLLHQRDGGGLRGHRRRRRRPRRRDRATTRGSAAAFLNAGIGFGGGCLPKDIRAFVHRAGELGVEDAMSFLREVDDVNQRQRGRVVDVAQAMVGGDLVRCADRGLGRGVQARQRRRPRLARRSRSPAASHLRGAQVAGLRPARERDRP